MTNYRKELIQTIKDMGQELINRAESMVHDDCDMITNFSISIDIPQPMDGFPELTWSTTVLNKTVYEHQIDANHSEGEVEAKIHAESVTVEKKEPAAMCISYVDSINCCTVFKCPRCGATQRVDGMLYGETRFCDICNK